MRTLIYLDESGDLGWTFDKPYQQGGSSRKLSITAIVIPEHKIKLITRIVSAMYRKRNRPFSHELKSVDLSSKERENFVSSIIKLKQENPDIKFYSITISKCRVKKSLRQHPNNLYNYMIKKMLLQELCRNKHIDFVPDARCEKVLDGWSLAHYLKQMVIEESLLIDVENETLNVTAMESAKSKELQFVDFYTGLIWAKYEFKSTVIDAFLDMEGVQDTKLF